MAKNLVEAYGSKQLSDSSLRLISNYKPTTEYRQNVQPQTTAKKKKKKKNKGGFWGGIGYTLGKLGTGAFSVVEGIWDYTAGGIADLFGADEWAEEQFANNIAAGWNQDLDEWYNPSSGWKMAGDVASGVGNTLTGIAGATAVTIFTGGAAAPYAGMIAAGTMGLGAAGNATSEAYAKTGKLGFKEYAYGALSGGTEMALEKVVGTGGRYASKIFGKQTAKTVAKKSFLKNVGKDFAGEFFEESISEFITPYYQRWTQVDPNAENATIQQIGYAGLVGGLSGGLMGGIGTGISTVQSINRGDKIAKNQAYANAVVEMSEKFAKYETENNTGKEAYRYVTELVNDFKARDNGTGNLTLGQKKILGQMERANVVLAFEPEIQRSKEKILANADAFAEYVNSRNIIDGTTGKPFHFENGAALAKNDGLVTQFAVADALGELLLTPDSVYDVVSKNRTGEVLQADYLNFQKNATSQQKAAVKEVFGVDVDSTTYDDFIAATQKVDKLTIDKIQGGMSARASSRKALSNAMATNAEVVAFDKNTKLSDGTSVYKTANGKLYAVTKIGEGYYLFNGKDISKKLSKEGLVKAIDELNGVKAETKQEGEKTAKTAQKTKKESKTKTSSTETKTKQESETSKPKTTSKKKATGSTTQYAISESATQEMQIAGGKSQNLTPLQMKRAESFARTHVKGYENLTAAEKLEVEWTIASGWRYGASESDILSLAKISAQSGVGIGFADLKATTSDGEVVAPDAACYSRGGHLTIYLNPKSKRTVEVATLHELTHALKGAKGYVELEKMALEYYAKHPKEKAIIDNAYRALYQNEQLRYEKEVLPDELTAHYIEKMLEKRNVLAQLTAEQPTFMQRCINWLKTRVDKLRGIDTQVADEVDMLARKFVSTFNLNKGKIGQQDKAQYALGKTYPDGVDLIDNYTEKQYNNFGWARVNGVLSYRENGNFKAKYGGIKSGKQKGVHRTSKGEIIVETNDMEGGKHGVNNVLVFAKGSYEDYRITKVIRLKINNETELEKVRDYIYGKETDEYRKSYYQTDDIIGLLYEEEYITRHTAQDFPAYKQIKQSREKSGRNDTDSGIGAIGNGNLNIDSNNGKGKRLSGLDKSYLKLVEYGYMKTAQRMVDEEAKNAGYTIKAFHGSKSEFTFFDESKRGSNTKTETSKRWFFAADKKTANSYYPYGTMQKIYEQHPEWKWANPETLKNKGKLYSLYLKMDNPLIVDVADYDYAAHRETADAWMEFVEIADKNGNDGIILYNAMDNQLDTAARNSTVYMFRKSSQAKSADVVTYDNDGNVIPLSERFNSKKTDIHYALPVVDSDGKALSAAQQEFFKDSKAVDGKGRLLPLYHGTNNTEFTVFDEAKIGASTRNEGIFGKGFYFTNNQNYAGYYNRKDNNLAKDGSGRVLDVYLNLKNPFMWNTIKTEQDVQALAESLGLPKGTITYNRTQSELHAITDNAKIRRFTDALKKAGYDGVIYTYPQSSDEKRHNRFTSEYVAFYPEQIKLTSNTNPTESPDIRYALSVDGETTPVDVEEGKNLVALHNLSEDKLLRVVELGGFPMPSIAVTTTELPHENYGDITVVFGRETIDPETDYRNVVYDRDAWTPTTPTVDVKLSNEAVDALIKELQDKVKGYSAYERNIFSFFDGKYRTNNGDYIVSDMDYTKESFGERAIRSSGIVAAYLSEKGVNVEPVYTERGFTMGWSSFTRKEATELFDFVGITKDITRYNATQEQRDAILEKFIEYRAKEKLGLMRRFKKDKTLTIEQVKESLRGEYNDGHVSQLFFMAEDFFNEKRPKDIYDEYATLEKMQSEITDKQDFFDWFWNKVESTFEKKGIDNDSDIFDSRGNRRSFEQRHYSYTAANIVRAMQHGDQEGNIPLGMTAGALAAKLSKRFDNIEDIREAKEYLALVSEEDLKAFNDKTYELYDELVTTIAGRTSDFMSDSSRRDDVGDILGKCAAVKPLTIENIKRKFSSETRGYNLGYKFNDQIAEQALLLFESLKHIPTTYFEAKPRRVVGFGEIKTVLIPETASDKLKTQLSKKKIKWQVYGEGDNSRSKIIKTMDNARFALPLKGSDKVMTKLPNDKVTLKDVISGKATKEELKAQAKANRSEKLEATKVLMTNAQAGVERVLTEGGTKNASAVTNYVRAGRAAAMNAIEKDGSQYNLDGTQRVGMSLGAIMMPIYEDYKNGESTYEDFELYLLHWHNIDRYEAGKPVFHEMGAPIEEHVTPDDSRKAIAELDKQYPDFKQRAEKVWKFNDNNLQMRLDGGLYTQEYVDAIREMYPHYVPTYREEYATKAAMLMGRNSVRVSNSKKKAQGSSSRILPIDDSMAAQTIQVTTTARLNKMLVTMAENGNTDDFQIIESEDAEMDVDKETEVTFYANKDKNDYQVTFYHNGKQVTARCSWTVYKGIEAYRGSDDMNNNVAIAAVAKGNSLFKKLVTSWNPFFSFFKNPIRDMQDALINTRYSAVKFLKNYARAHKEIKSNGKYWQEAKAAGISAASLYDQEKGIEYKQQESRIKEKGKKVMQSLEKASNSLEMTPRLAEYICAREAGFSPQDALLQAQDVTTNFGRGGTFAKKLNSTIMPFLNPSIQGFSKVWRAYFTAENGKKQWISLIIKSLILGVGITALNDLLNDDDEEYESLSDYVKEQNYVLGLGGGDFLKIPKGRVVSVFGSAFLRGKRYSQGDSEAWKGYFDTVTSAVTPVDNITRNIFSPITDVQTNTAWYGGAIESQKWDDTEPKNRYDESTSKISIWLGNLFNYSPIKIDYLLEQYTGIVGDLVLPATSTQAESGIVSQNLLANGITNSKWSTNFYSTIEKYTYKKTAGDLQAKGVVKYLNKMRGTVSDMYNDKRKIQASKSLSDSEKLKETKIMQAAINTLMQEAIGNAEYIYQEMGKYDLSTDELFDQAYLDCISVVMGAEYALKSYNKDVYEKATKLNTLGIDYGSYYNFYFGLKDITSDKTIDGKTVAGSKKANVINYVMSQNLSTAQKLVLIMAQGYSIADGDVKGLTAKQAKTTVAKYIASLNLTKEEKTELAKMLGFTVKNGKIYFN